MTRNAIFPATRLWRSHPRTVASFPANRAISLTSEIGMGRVYTRDTVGARRSRELASPRLTPYNSRLMRSPHRTLLRLSVCVVLLAGAGCTRSESHQAPDLFYLYKTIEVGKNPTSIATGDLNGDHV